LRFVKLYNDGSMYGSKRFDPALILKMEIFAYLHNRNYSAFIAKAL
jgi:hypothetical protein